VPALRPGAVLDGRYEVQSLIATGGMGEIWRSTDLQLQRTVAIKVLRTVDLPDPRAAERLEVEARAAAMLRSDHVVRVHDLGFYDDGRTVRAPYLVMELVEGSSLKDVLRDQRTLSPDRLEHVLRQVTDALVEAHGLGLVHRDIKPANVLVASDGTVKLTDFGIASLAEPSGLTVTGTVVGTARYLSPEQVSGRRATAASDVYALGVVAHECLSGGALFSAESDVAAALAHVQQAPRPLPSSVPAHLAALVLAMLAKDPAHRPTAAGVLAALDGAPVAVSSPTKHIPLVAAVPVSRRRHRHRAALGAGLVTVAGMTGLLLGLAGTSGAGTPAVSEPTRAPATTAPVVRPAAQVLKPTATPSSKPVSRTAARPVVRKPALKPAPAKRKSHVAKQRHGKH
jgi:serine/threonine protein kinase